MTSTRTSFVDRLRGIALLGIVLVNAPFLGMSALGAVNSPAMPWWDSAALWFVNSFAEGKFYLIFSFVFGYSAFRFMKIQSGEGRHRFKRRLWALAALGILHAWLFFIGDILFGYSLLGIALLTVSKKPFENRRRLAIGTAALTASVFVVIGVLLRVIPVSSTPEPWETRYNVALGSGSFIDCVVARMGMWPLIQIGLAVLNYGFGFCMMLLGSLAADNGLLENPDPNARVWSLGRRLGLGVGLPIAILAGTIKEDWIVPIVFVFAPFLSWGYVSVLVSLHAKSVRWLGAFESAGRMSMTCYILESVILATVFCGWGFGLYGKLGVAAVTGIAVLSCIVTEVFAKLYLSRYRQGPLESIVSRWTKGKSGAPQQS